MPAEDVPASLRPIARFTAAKRIRLGGPGAGRGGGEQPDFRQRLADLVRRRPARIWWRRSDPARSRPRRSLGDVITWRTSSVRDGWRSIIAAATPAESGQSGDEVERMRAELADLRRSSRAEAGRRRMRWVKRWLRRTRPPANCGRRWAEAARAHGPSSRRHRPRCWPPGRTRRRPSGAVSRRSAECADSWSEAERAVESGAAVQPHRAQRVNGLVRHCSSTASRPPRPGCATS